LFFDFELETVVLQNVIQQHGSNRALKKFEVSFAIDLKQNTELDLQVLVTTVPANLF
jgi:hypothetical protein